MDFAKRQADVIAQNLNEIAWVHIQENRQREFLEKELHLEVGRDHSLFGKQVMAVAVSTSEDDVLFIIDDIEFPYAVVHLTYHLHPEPSPSPSAERYTTIQDFLKDFR